MRTKEEILLEKAKRRQTYIDRYQNSNDPDELLRVVRYILQTPEGESITVHAKEIMKTYAKNKTKTE